MKRNTRWYLLAVIAGALLAGAALWAARAFLTAPVAVLGIFGLAGGLLLFCGLAELLSAQDLDPARRERDREDHDERGAMIRDKAVSGEALQWAVMAAAWLSIGLDAPLWVPLAATAVFVAKSVLELWLMVRYEREM